jgi:hypothetical protein
MYVSDARSVTRHRRPLAVAAESSGNVLGLISPDFLLQEVHMEGLQIGELLTSATVPIRPYAVPRVSPTWLAEMRMITVSTDPSGTAICPKCHIACSPGERRPALSTRRQRRSRCARPGQGRRFASAKLCVVSPERMRDRGYPSGQAGVRAVPRLEPSTQRRSKPCLRQPSREVPRGFRTVHPIGWTSGKVK